MSKVTDAIFISFGFRNHNHKCGEVTVVFAHEVSLSIAGANQELTRLHDTVNLTRPHAIMSNCNRQLLVFPS